MLMELSWFDGNTSSCLHVCSPAISAAVALLYLAHLYYRHSLNIQQVPVELITPDGQDYSGRRFGK